MLACSRGHAANAARDVHSLRQPCRMPSRRRPQPRNQGQPTSAIQLQAARWMICHVLNASGSRSLLLLGAQNGIAAAGWRALLCLVQGPNRHRCEWAAGACTPHIMPRRGRPGVRAGVCYGGNDEVTSMENDTLKTRAWLQKGRGQQRAEARRMEERRGKGASRRQCRQLDGWRAYGAIDMVFGQAPRQAGGFTCTQAWPAAGA